MGDRSIRWRGTRPGASHRLLAFPHAGAGINAFRGWADGLPESVEVCAVQLPGREDRIEEPPRCDLSRLVAELTPAVRKLLDRPIAFFGHSLGATIAHEVARRLGSTGPVHFFVSACAAPGGRTAPSNVHLLPDHLFAQAVRRLSEAPSATLQDPEWRRVYLPILRADLGLAASHLHLPGRQLDCPITAFAGLADEVVAEGELAAWAGQTSSTFRLRRFPGDHFFIRSSRALVLSAIAEGLGVEGAA